MRKLVLGAGSVILLAVFPLASGVVPERDSEGLQIIQEAIESAGGARNWEQAGTLVVHEIQSRYMPKGSSEVRLVHYLDTNRKRYRVEIEGEEGKKVFAWDGESFWATLNAPKGDAGLLGEAQRAIANGCYRFGLPFNLLDPEAQIEYVGADTVDGMETEVVKVSYEQGPTSRYWQSETGGDQPDAASHGGTAPQEEANHDDGHGPSGHHSGRETYYYHFDTTNHEIKKIYFSHHGDDSFETLYLREYPKINGINREHSQENSLVLTERNCTTPGSQGLSSGRA